jgi:death on curing protein
VDPQFLTLEEILAIHEDRVRKYGGSSGLRDLGLLQSAIGTVSATFGGEYLHQSIFEMAAAYLFHIAKNHAFIDGNKRTALTCSLAFLRLNGVRAQFDERDLYDLVIGVAEGRVTKSEIAVFFQRHAR